MKIFEVDKNLQSALVIRKCERKTTILVKISVVGVLSDVSLDQLRPRDVSDKYYLTMAKIIEELGEIELLQFTLFVH